MVQKYNLTMPRNSKNKTSDLFVSELGCSLIDKMVSSSRPSLSIKVDSVGVK